MMPSELLEQLNMGQPPKLALSVHEISQPAGSGVPRAQYLA